MNKLKGQSLSAPKIDKNARHVNKQKDYSNRDHTEKKHLHVPKSGTNTITSNNSVKKGKLGTGGLIILVSLILFGVLFSILAVNSLFSGDSK